MAQKTYSVYFAKPLVGVQGGALANSLEQSLLLYGPHLPSAVVENERYQIRSLSQVGTVWKGVFAKLRDDTPNYVDHLNEERELELADGAAIIEKCQFLYRAQHNVLVWQINRSGGGMQKAASYLSAILNNVVQFPMVQNNAQLEDMLNNNLYELQYQYAQPNSVPEGVDQWSQRYFDIMGEAGASYATFKIRASRGKKLTKVASEKVKEMLGRSSYRRIKIRVSEDTDFVKLFLAPLKEEFTIEVPGRYPDVNKVYQGLEDAYTRQQQHIAGN